MWYRYFQRFPSRCLVLLNSCQNQTSAPTSGSACAPTASSEIISRVASRTAGGTVNDPKMLTSARPPNNRTAANGGGTGSERLDEIAAARYGNPGWWRLIAAFNHIDNPWELPAGRLLAIPPLSGAGATS